MIEKIPNPSKADGDEKKAVVSEKSEVTVRYVVNPVALQNCEVRLGESVARVLDISYVRVLIESSETWASLAEGQKFPLGIFLDRIQFTSEASVKAKGEGWIRLAFDKMLPSSRAHLRSFLSPKKIGESILEDWRHETVRHYHGLNESELWFDPDGGTLFTYLDPVDSESQFIIRMTDLKGPLSIGKIRRREYLELRSLEGQLPLIPLSDRDTYARLGECRDIVTNFRPSAQMEYHLKQRLLKVISDHLYSTSHKVEMNRHRSPRSTS